jgi:hypothetical protein
MCRTIALLIRTCKNFPGVMRIDRCGRQSSSRDIVLDDRFQREYILYSIEYTMYSFGGGGGWGVMGSSSRLVSWRIILCVTNFFDLIGPDYEINCQDADDIRKKMLSIPDVE